MATSSNTIDKLCVDPTTAALDPVKDADDTDVTLHRKISLSRASTGYPSQVMDISFDRTFRLSNSGNIYKISDGGTMQAIAHLGKLAMLGADQVPNLPAEVDGRPQFYLPMQPHEAAWIRFSTGSPFAVKIYSDGVNIVSGRPFSKTAVAMENRQKLLDDGKPTQDYVVAREQVFVNSIGIKDDSFHQIIAKPPAKDAAHSVDAGIPIGDLGRCLRFEVIPMKFSAIGSRDGFSSSTNAGLPGSWLYSITVRVGSSNEYPLTVSDINTTRDIKQMLEDLEGSHYIDQRIFYDGKQMADQRTLGDLGVVADSTLQLVTRSPARRHPRFAWKRGDRNTSEDTLIVKDLVKDEYDSDAWDWTAAVTFDVHILDTGTFNKITGLSQAIADISRQTYEKHGHVYPGTVDEKLTKGSEHGAANSKDTIEGNEADDWIIVDDVESVPNAFRTDSTPEASNGTGQCEKAWLSRLKVVRERFYEMSI